MSKFAVFLPLLLLAACGGSAPPADAPKASEDSAEAKPKEQPDASAKPKRSAQDILTAPDVVFMLSFNDSDVKQAAESKCTASSGNDPKKMNQCMAKARKTPGLDVDGYRFKQKDNKWYWLTLRTQGKILHTMHKFEIEFG